MSKQIFNLGGVADIDRVMLAVGMTALEPTPVPFGRGLGTEEGAPHVVVDAYDVHAERGEELDGFLSNQPGGPCHQRHAHEDSLQLSTNIDRAFLLRTEAIFYRVILATTGRAPWRCPWLRERLGPESRAPDCKPERPSSDNSTMVKPGRERVRQAHIAFDVVVVAIAWLAAWATRSGLDPLMARPINEVSPYLMTLPLIVFGWIASCWTFGIYDSTRIESATDQIRRFIRGTMLGFAVVATIAFFGRELEIGRAVVILTACYCFVFQGLSRLGFRRLEHRWRSAGHFDIPVLILGAGVTGVRLVQKLEDHPEIGFRMVGFLDNDSSLHDTKVCSYPVFGGFDQICEVVTAHEVAEVFLAAPSMGRGEMLSRVLDCEDLNVGVWAVTNSFEVLTNETRAELVGDLPVVRLGSQRPGALYAVTKRALDIGCASVGLIALAPFFAWWVWRIRRESPGPALFIQDRVGRDGRLFRLWKFRTMRSDTEAYAKSPSRPDDPRTTPYGAWLRKTSIDELPQLWNVFKGEMSLVGPRPEMPFMVDRYEAWQRRRLSAKPGITGLWQILGRKDLPMHENLQYDFYYIRNRSLGLDLSLLLRTVGVVLARRGAY